MPPGKAATEAREAGPASSGLAQRRLARPGAGLSFNALSSGPPACLVRAIKDKSEIGKA